jgi:predicted ATP-dependent protease
MTMRKSTIICEAKSLTGSQGVIIPESNVCNLMLKESIDPVGLLPVVLE